MTPHDPQSTDDPLEWLSRAQGNLLRAQTADLLTTYAVETRYPGVEPVTESEYEEAVALAETVVAWAEKQVSR